MQRINGSHVMIGRRMQLVLIIILVLASSMIYIKVCLEEDSGGVIG